MTIQIIESGMTFGSYPSERCFNIEKSTLYKGLGDGIKIAEFALLRPTSTSGATTVWLIEAKSSSPRPETQPNFDEFISEIVEKMSNTLHILVAALLNRHPDTAELSDDFKSLDLKMTIFKCVLVINGHKEEWLTLLQDALNEALKPLVKTMALGSQAVAVINEVKAKERGIISASESI
jgi:hypothetical protein